MRAVGLDPNVVAAKAAELMAHYAIASDYAEEKRLVRAALYSPLMKLTAAERARRGDLAVKILVPEDVLRRGRGRRSLCVAGRRRGRSA